jgi:hypothetical protein
MIDEIKLMLGDAADNFSEPQIELAYRMAAAEVEDYCNRELDTVLEYQAQRIAVIKLNRMNSEGLASQGFSGISETYIDGLPADILAALNRKRRIKVV